MGESLLRAEGADAGAAEDAEAAVGRPRWDGVEAAGVEAAVIGANKPFFLSCTLGRRRVGQVPWRESSKQKTRLRMCAAWRLDRKGAGAVIRSHLLWLLSTLHPAWRYILDLDPILQLDALSLFVVPMQQTGIVSRASRCC